MSAYECERHATVAAFLERAAAWLLQREAEHNLVLGITEQLKVAPDPNAYLATLEHDGEMVGCAFRTPPHKLGVTRMPKGAAQALARDVAAIFDDIPAVLGPEAVAQVVAGGIAGIQGKRAEPGMPQRIYELREVIPLRQPPPGRLRLAQIADTAHIAWCLEQFGEESGQRPPDAKRYAQTHIASKSMFVWDDEGAKSTVAWGGSTPHGVRIAFVFTPLEFRRRGYASAGVAAASQRAFDSGYQFCCLYTDLANPTSNSIYQRIGFRHVCDVRDYLIIEAPSADPDNP